MKILILWNDNGFSKILAGHFGKDNVITHKEKLKGINYNAYDAIAVLCELNWGKEQSETMSDAAGIDLVIELRMQQNLTLPVLLVSFLPLENLYTSKKEIVTAIGHYYQELPADPASFAAALKNTRKLTSTELKDIQLFACDPRGVVNIKIHQIQGVLNAFMAHKEISVKEKLIQCIQEIHSVFQLPDDIALNEFNKQFADINTNNINRAIRFIEETGKNIIEKYNSGADSKDRIVQKVRPWKLLLLDDEIDENSELVTLLQDMGLQVICTANAETAMEVLSKDDSLRGKISLILTDYRLYESAHKVQTQQKIQGYTFLQQVGEQFHSKLISAIVYSGMPRQFLLDTYKTFKIRTEIYSKIDFKLNDPGARNFLANRIIELGDANHATKLALPLSNAGWRDYLHEPYLLYRAQPDYENRERAICDYCNEWIIKFRNNLNPETPMIKGDNFNPDKKESEEEKLKRFEAFFKTRRLAQYLYLFYEARKDNQIHEKIIKHLAKFAKPTSYSTPEHKRRFFSQTIGFKTDEFPFGATLEELCWLEYDMGIPVLQGYNKYRAKMIETELLIGRFVAETPLLILSLEDSGFRYASEREHELIFNQEEYYPYVFDRLDVGLCLEWIDKHKNKFDKENIENYFNLIGRIKEQWK